MEEQKKQEMEFVDVTDELIREKTFEIRGQKVMLDMDLARIYGYETKNFNRQVKNNIEKFPEDFMFQLTREEALRCKIFASSWPSTIRQHQTSRKKDRARKNICGGWAGRKV